MWPQHSLTKKFHVSATLCMRNQLFLSLSLSPISFIWCPPVLQLEHTVNIQQSEYSALYMPLLIGLYQRLLSCLFPNWSPSSLCHSLIQIWSSLLSFSKPFQLHYIFYIQRSELHALFKMQANNVFTCNVMFCSVFLSLYVPTFDLLFWPLVSKLTCSQNYPLKPQVLTPEIPLPGISSAHYSSFMRTGLFVPHMDHFIITYTEFHLTFY